MERIPVPVRFLDVCFGGGVPDQALTLYPNDGLTVAPDGDIIVQFREKTQETIVMHGMHIRFYSLREGVVLVPKPEEGHDVSPPHV